MPLQSSFTLTPRRWKTAQTCRRQLWYMRTTETDPDNARPPWRTSATKHRVHVESRKLFPEGNFWSTDSGFPDTGTWFDLKVSIENLSARVDILTIHPGRRVDIYRVKASTRIYDRYLDELVFQAEVLIRLGFVVRSVIFLHLNSHATTLEPSDLFTSIEVTEKVLVRLPVFRSDLNALTHHIESDTAGKPRLGYHCMECAFRLTCWGFYPEHPVFWLSALNEIQIDEIRTHRWLDMRDLPSGFELTDRQLLVKSVHQTNQPFINKEFISPQLELLKAPLAYLDFEADNPPFPRYPGMKPFEQIPYQFSLIIENDDQTHNSVDFLHREYSDPRPALINALSEIKHFSGSLVVYNQLFEKQVLTRLAEFSPEDAHWLMSLTDQLWDLQEVIQHGLYLPSFNGKFSLKNVVHALIPEYGYKNLAVQSGLDSQYMWNWLLEGNGKESDWDDLLAYCRTDTEGMMKVLNAVRVIIGNSQS